LGGSVGRAILPLVSDADPSASPAFDWAAYPVLVVDDEADNLDAFRFNFRRAFSLHLAGSGAEALRILEDVDIAIVVCDQRMPRMSGLEVLKEAAAIRPEMVGILVTAYTDIGTLVDAVNSGHVYRYVAKPWDSKELGLTLRQAIETYHLRRENRRLMDRLRQLSSYLDGEVREVAGTREIIGRSKALGAVMDNVRSVAPTQSTVLILGESGTGKELVARAIHDQSPRAAKAFVRVACGALAPGVLESELFGHEKGAFTGAIRRKLGRFELAHGGTLFLDEVGDLPLETQVRLLRVLQEREFERVGGTETISVDVRVISATNRDLEAQIGAGTFREDLYYRLNVFPVAVPPLRSRPDDVPLLVEHFLTRSNQTVGRSVKRVAPEAMARMVAYPWPGNVRELENVVERAVIRATGEELGMDLIDLEAISPRAEAMAVAATTDSAGESLSDRLDVIERSELVRALHEAEGRKAEAARSLGINRSTLYYRLRKHGLE
jgi:two-component system response regulator AtoC